MENVTALLEELRYTIAAAELPSAEILLTAGALGTELGSTLVGNGTPTPLAIAGSTNVTDARVTYGCNVSAAVPVLS
jgi:hypothetical protein